MFATKYLQALDAGGVTGGPVVTTEEHYRLREVLAKIDPPAPPTLEEAIELLRDMQGNGSFDAEYGNVGRPQAEKARDILARAYRARVLKE